MGKKKKHHIISHDELLTLSNTVVMRYSLKGAIPKRDREDVAMSIVEKFLLAEEKLTSAFKGDSKISTYCIAILNRMCCEIIRKDFKRWKEVQEFESPTEPDNQTHTLETSKNTIIKSELSRFNQIIEFAGKEKSKTILFLKYIFGIPFTIENVKDYNANDFNNLYSILNNSVEESLGNKYKILAEINNTNENTNIAGDAIRMWLNKQTNTIITRLNGHGTSNYDKETLGILLELL